jgi:hypothetical protein
MYADIGTDEKNENSQDAENTANANDGPKGAESKAESR